MKLSTLIFAGTITSAAFMAGVQVHGQSVDATGLRPTRLPSVQEWSVEETNANRVDFSERTAATGINNAGVVTSDPVRPRFGKANSSLSGMPPSAGPRPWLQSTTAMASSAKALEKLEQAKVEFQSKAWLSAEQSTWEAISLFSQAIDLRGEGIDAGNRFRVAKDAILEARDFGSNDATTDPELVLRRAKSHRTKLITANDVSGLTAAVAADRYLDSARRNLAPIAASDPRCAEAIDFLAAIYLGRGESRQLPGETALCLRRAALQGQPGNADLAARLGMQLADVGLVDEAKWAMEHSLQIQFQPVIADRLVLLMRQTGQDAAANQWANQIEVRSRFREGVPAESPVAMPVITQLSPSEFASVSKSVMQGQARSSSDFSSSSSSSSKAGIPASLASTRLHDVNPSVQMQSSNLQPEADSEIKKPNPVRRWFQAIKSPWKGSAK